jgi:uncharacterized spore protein YtfJ
MSVVETIATLLGSNATARSVFGDAVAVQGRIIVPAARISYGIGGGTGENMARTTVPEAGVAAA